MEWLTRLGAPPLVLRVRAQTPAQCAAVVSFIFFNNNLQLVCSTNHSRVRGVVNELENEAGLAVELDV